MLVGKNVNLRVVEREDVDYLVECVNGRPWGEYVGVSEQITKSQQMKYFDNPSNLTESKWFIIQKKDGAKIGLMNHRLALPSRCVELGALGLIPSEQGKGYGTEATQLMVDYLFLSKDIERIQLTIHVENVTSQRVVERVGFKREGLLRKLLLIKGKWIDFYIYSILREEWKEPKILTKNA
ncbi:MAG TPA: GNAT family protein [candidate division Zixibacteria bacterium]|nr:GNAT family protein [candidate division Zixibacteria bacterium]